MSQNVSSAAVVIGAFRVKMNKKTLPELTPDQIFWSTCLNKKQTKKSRFLNGVI